MKIGIIGLGYWGKILLKTIKTIPLDVEVITCDAYNLEAYTLDYRDLKECSQIFIATPVAQHSEICRYSLSRGIFVFCEKPLVMSVLEAVELYNLAVANEAFLFVDWVFTFNNQVRLIKALIKNETYGKLKSISMNRQNLGPVRNDVTAKYDLASHDVSIALYLLGEVPERTNWIGYKRNKESKINDSCHGLMQFEDITVQINASWHYGKKDRLCIFEFEKGFLTWEDNLGKLFINEEDLFEEGPTPLVNSVWAFLNVQDEAHGDFWSPLENAQITIDTLRVLENENSF